jgi:hypothetical protein
MSDDDEDDNSRSQGLRQSGGYHSEFALTNNAAEAYIQLGYQLVYPPEVADYLFLRHKFGPADGRTVVSLMHFISSSPVDHVSDESDPRDLATKETLNPQ